MATQESQYWKFLEENPGSTLTFEEWQKHMAKKLFGYVEELTENPLDKLEDELDGFENVRYRMDAEGFHYCFKHYSSFKEIKDEKFHELRRKYLEVSEDLEKYVHSKINELTDKINSINDEELN
jgi:regulator of replication initiation timing